jgi:hypothetical protein
MSVLGLLTPVASFYRYFNMWMWGLMVARLPDTVVEFNNDGLIFISGISVSVMILVFSLVLIISSYWYHRGFYEYRNFGKLWIISGIVMVAGVIEFVVVMDFYTHHGFFMYGFWSSFTPGFGVTGPFIGSILAISVGIFVHITEKELRMRKRAVPMSAFAPKSVCPHCRKPVSLNASFCSKCGKLIEEQLA